MPKTFSVNFPDIGEGVVEGEVIQWLKQVNDPVKEHEPVLIVMTDKATVELPSPYNGKLVKQYYREGDTAIHDKPMYDVEVSDMEREAPSIEKNPQESAPTPQKVALDSLKKKEKTVPVTKAMPKQERNEHALAAPATRHLAKELGIDINEIAGTGKDGRVTKEDVTHHHVTQSHEVSPEGTPKRSGPEIHSDTPILHWDDDEEFPLRGLRNFIARKMTESKNKIPHFSYFEQMDATRLVQLREKIKPQAAKEGFSLTYMPFFMRALSLTLKKYPIFNGSIDTQENVLVVHKHHNIGIAFKTEAGLIVPVLKNVQEMTLPDIIKQYEALKLKATSGKLEPADMRDATITISNFGTLGGRWATPIINYPEVAILGVARIHKEPVVINDNVVAREMLNLSWSFDHRIIDGDAAALFSNFFISILKNPASML